jgi:hypothetical protein
VIYVLCSSGVLKSYLAYIGEYWQDLAINIYEHVDAFLQPMRANSHHHYTSTDFSFIISDTVNHTNSLYAKLYIYMRERERVRLKDLMILELGVRTPLWDVGAGLSDETV